MIRAGANNDDILEQSRSVSVLETLGPMDVLETPTRYLDESQNGEVLCLKNRIAVIFRYLNKNSYGGYGTKVNGITALST